jgi:hypothetical protein
MQTTSGGDTRRTAGAFGQPKPENEVCMAKRTVPRFQRINTGAYPPTVLAGSPLAEPRRALPDVKVQRDSTVSTLK